MLDAVRAMYNYNAWANARILETASPLETSQFLAPWEDGKSLRDILVHTASAQWIWLERLQGRSPRKMWDPDQFPDLPSLRERWSEVEATTRAYIAALEEEDLYRDIGYGNTRGRRNNLAPWQILFHQTNHATQHRSEVAVLLTRLGHSPGDLDLTAYYRALATRG